MNNTDSPLHEPFEDTQAIFNNPAREEPQFNQFTGPYAIARPLVAPAEAKIGNETVPTHMHTGLSIGF